MPKTLELTKQFQAFRAKLAGLMASEMGLRLLYYAKRKGITYINNTNYFFAGSLVARNFWVRVDDEYNVVEVSREEIEKQEDEYVFNVFSSIKFENEMKKHFLAKFDSVEMYRTYLLQFVNKDLRGKPIDKNLKVPIIPEKKKKSPAKEIKDDRWDNEGGFTSKSGKYYPRIGGKRPRKDIK